MANQETAFGLRPVGVVGSGVNSTGTSEYEISSSEANPIYQFGLVEPVADGTIQRITSTAGDGNALGVLIGIEYVDSATKKPTWLNYWPGSGSVSVDTNYPVKALVVDDPSHTFVVAADASVTNRAGALALVHSNCSLGTSAQDGSSSNGRSTAQLNVASANTTATLPLRVIGVVNDPANNDYASAGVHFKVKLNTPFMTDTTGV